jgi:hypothetical protein
MSIEDLATRAEMRFDILIDLRVGKTARAILPTLPDLTC